MMKSNNNAAAAAATTKTNTNTNTKRYSIVGYTGTKKAKNIKKTNEKTVNISLERML